MPLTIDQISTIALPLANLETNENLFAFKLERTIEYANQNGCTDTCRCSRCIGIVKFEEWLALRTRAFASFTELMDEFIDYEASRFPDNSEDGFYDSDSSKRHIGLTGSGFDSHLDSTGMITCQGLYDNDFEPPILCLANPVLTCNEIRRIVRFLGKHLKEFHSINTVPRGSRFGRKHSQIGPEVLTSLLKNGLQAMLEESHALGSHFAVRGATSASVTMPTAAEKITAQPDKFVWVGEYSPTFSGKPSDLGTPDEVKSYLDKVGVFSTRNIFDVPESADEM